MWDNIIVRQGDWLMLVDSDPVTDPAGTLAIESMVGGWVVAGGGELGLFRPNPRYRPADPAAPADPIDALLRRGASGVPVGGDLLAAVCGSVVEIGCDTTGIPVTGIAPDGVQCVPVVSAAIHRGRLDIPQWLPVAGAALPDVLPAGADILLNPESPARFRLAADAVARARSERSRRREQSREYLRGN